MSVNSKYLLIVVVLFFISCKKEPSTKNIEEKNTYQIITNLLSDLRESMILPPRFPPPPSNEKYNYTIQDSLSSYKYFYKQTIRKKTIAFLPETFILDKKKEKAKTLEKCTTDKNLIHLFLTRKKEKNIAITKIANLKKDSLIYYTEKHKMMLGKGFQEIDMLLSFSNITFNKDYTKAIIIVGVSYGKLNGFSTLIYLEKKHYHWKIKCEKVLTIS